MYKRQVPGVDGLSLGAGYALLNNSDKEAAAVSNKDQQEGTVYAKYSVGAFSFGAQKSIVDVAAANNVTFDTEYYGISYAVSDNLSLSYNEIESTKESEAGEIEQDLDSISISYTMGGMTIGILDADSSNDTYSSGSSKSARSVSMSIAF